MGKSYSERLYSTIKIIGFGFGNIYTEKKI